MRPLPKKIRKLLLARLKELSEMAESGHFERQTTSTGICYLVVRANCFYDITQHQREAVRQWLRAAFVDFGFHATFPVERVLLGSDQYAYLYGSYHDWEYRHWKGTAGIFRRMLLLLLIQRAESEL